MTKNARVGYAAQRFRRGKSRRPQVISKEERLAASLIWINILASVLTVLATGLTIYQLLLQGGCQQ